MAKWLELMRTGTFRDRFGNTYDITREILARIAANFSGDDDVHLVVGHPGKKSVPSFGLVDKLRAIGDKLEFIPKMVVPEFSALVKKGGFPDRSAGLDSGLTKLNHIAFLSAERPAIDGMLPIAAFSSPEGDTNVVHLILPENSLTDVAEFSLDGWIVWKFKSIARLLRNLKNKAIESETAEKAEEIYPEYIIESLLEEPPEKSAFSAGSQFSANEGGASMEYELLYKQEKQKREELEGKVAEFSGKVENLIAKVTDLETANAALAAENKTANDKLLTAEFSAYAEKLIADKKILPDQKEATVANLMTMHRASDGAEFSGDNGEKSPIALFKAQLESGNVVLPGGEHSADHRGGDGAEFSGEDFDPVAVGNAARSLVAKEAKNGNTITFQEAVKRVRNKN